MTPNVRSGQDRIYLAGPMSGIADFNYPAFNHAAEQLRAKGFVVENPAENTQLERQVATRLSIPTFEIAEVL